LLILAIYVDDIPILSNNLSALNAAKTEVSSAFSMSDLGPLEFCLGVQVQRDQPSARHYPPIPAEVH